MYLLICLTVVLREIAVGRIVSATSVCRKEVLHFCDLEML